MVVALGNVLGKFIEVDTNVKGKCWGETLRIKIRIDFRKPLRRGTYIKLGLVVEESWIRISYKRVLKFCY